MSDNSEVYNSFANKKGYAYYDPTLGEGRMNVDWNNPNIYKASIPIIFGLNSTRDE